MLREFGTIQNGFGEQLRQQGAFLLLRGNLIMTKNRMQSWNLIVAAVLVSSVAAHAADVR